MKFTEAEKIKLYKDTTVNMINGFPNLEDDNDLIRELTAHLSEIAEELGAESNPVRGLGILYLLHVARTRLNGVCDVAICSQSARAQLIDSIDKEIK